MSGRFRTVRRMRCAVACQVVGRVKGSDVFVGSLIFLCASWVGSLPCGACAPGDVSAVMASSMLVVAMAAEWGSLVRCPLFVGDAV